MIDFNLTDDDRPTISTDLECLVQQIDIYFDTTPGQLIGDMFYGTEYDRFLHELKFDAPAIQDKMEQDLLSLDLMGFTPYVKVYLLQGTEQDIALVQVDLVKSGRSFSKTYKIT